MVAMNRKFLQRSPCSAFPAVVLLLMLAGCGAQEPSAQPTAAAPCRTALSGTASVQPGATLKKGASQPAAAFQWPAEFDLPLDIHIERPHVPERIARAATADKARKP